LERLAAALAEDQPELAVTAQAILYTDPEYRPDEFGTVVRDRYIASLPER
jgi:hypothetical protein